MQRSASLAVSTCGGSFRGSRLNHRSGILGGGSADPLAITILADETQPCGEEKPAPRPHRVHGTNRMDASREASPDSEPQAPHAPPCPCCKALLFQRRDQATAMASFAWLTDGSISRGLRYSIRSCCPPSLALLSDHTCLSLVVQHHVRFFLASGAVAVLSHSFSPIYSCHSLLLASLSILSTSPHSP